MLSSSDLLLVSILERKIGIYANLSEERARKVEAEASQGLLTVAMRFSQGISTLESDLTY